MLPAPTFTDLPSPPHAGPPAEAGGPEAPHDFALTLRRARLLADWSAAEAPWAARMAELLLTQDGSATRLCEQVAGGPVGLIVHHQRALTAAEAPPEVRASLPGDGFIERLVTLHAHGEVMMDNLSWLAPEALAPDIRAELAAGRTPIGHLLARMWIRRVAQPTTPALAGRLWQQVGLPDLGATRSYLIAVPAPQGAVDPTHAAPGRPAMFITECFRRGLLRPRPADPAKEGVLSQTGVSYSFAR